MKVVLDGLEVLKIARNFEFYRRVRADARRSISDKAERARTLRYWDGEYAGFVRALRIVGLDDYIEEEVR